MHYSTVFFDLYGTLIDINNDEHSTDTWEQFRTYLAKQGAVYDSAEQLRDLFWTSAAKLRSARFAEQSPVIDACPVKIAEDPAWFDPDYVPLFSMLFENRGVKAPADSDRVARAARMFREFSTAYMRLFPGAREMLRDLHEQGVQVILLSNAQRLYTVPELDKTGLINSFDRIFISSDHGWCKPSPIFFTEAVEATHADPSHSLMVGNDANSDIRGANFVHMDSVYLFTSSWPGNDVFPLSQATYNGRGADYELVKCVVSGKN